MARVLLSLYLGCLWNTFCLFTHDYLRKQAQKSQSGAARGESGLEPGGWTQDRCSQALQVVTDLTLAATGELSRGLGQSLEQQHVPQRSSELGLRASRSDLHRDQEVLSHQEAGTQASWPGGCEGLRQRAVALLSSGVCPLQGSRGGRQGCELGWMEAYRKS